jgi:hypothetical protein
MGTVEEDVTVPEPAGFIIAGLLTMGFAVGRLRR